MAHHYIDGQEMRLGDKITWSSTRPEGVILADFEKQTYMSNAIRLEWRGFDQGFLIRDRHGDAVIDGPDEDMVLISRSHSLENVVPPEDDQSGYAQGFRKMKIAGYTKEVEDIIIAECAAGDPRSLYTLGIWLYFGIERRKDFRKAAELMRRAATCGMHRAALNFGYFLEMGRGVRQDKEAAFRFYVAALSGGGTDAAIEVARCLYWGIGIPKDRSAADAIYASLQRTSIVQDFKLLKARRGPRGPLPPTPDLTPG